MSLNNHLKALKAEELRNTDQLIMPSIAPDKPASGYNIYPSFNISESIYKGYERLFQLFLQGKSNIMLDGYGGVYWELVKASLSEIFNTKGIKVNWVFMEDYQKSDAQIDQLISPFLGGADPLFGYIYQGELADFFDLQGLKHLSLDDNEVNIVYGCGAALANWDCPIVYFEVPKNEIQFRSRAGHLRNLGASRASDPKTMYKRFYFVDWVVLNKHKQSLISKIDVIVDEQRPDEITWTYGDTLRNALNSMSTHAFRARPWFEPGVWGGQWIKNNIQGLNQDVVNYAWSFELIAPENGIVLESNHLRLEVSIDMLLYNDNQAVLGKAANRFGCKFPIRFDFLDTMDGDNLSVQCHPSVAYTKNNFGEDFTQDETYYILEAGTGADVYLGFQEGIDALDFKSVLEESYRTNTALTVEEYVQKFPAKKHDLFLIPNGTVHCSGKNNLILEISATPYIFTFKMYDWVRPDLSGNPRTLNIDRAFDNLNFDRKGDVVKETLISKETLIEAGADWQLLNLSTHPEHFYAIERLEFETSVEDLTDDHCLILSLVEGESITVTTGNLSQIIHYAETFIIPAAAIRYTLINNGKLPAKVVKAYVKNECC